MISDTFHSGLLWAAYLLCLLLSGVQSPYPATSVVTVSANTLNTDPTYVVTSFAWCSPPLPFTSIAGFPRLYPCALYSSSSTSNLRVMTHDLTKRVEVSTGFTYPWDSVLKDSLILGATAWGSLSLSTWQLAVSGSVLSASPLTSGTITSGYSMSAFCDIGDSTTLVVASGNSNMIFKLDFTNKAIGVNVAMPGGAGYNYHLFFLPTLDGYYVCRVSGSVPILARVNFATIKNPTFAVSTIHCLSDNLDDQYSMMYTSSSTLRHFDRVSWTANDVVHTDINLSAVGTTNNILNFGPYQYVVTIPARSSAPSTIIGVSKITFTIDSNTLTIPCSQDSRLPYYGTAWADGNKYYLITRDLTSMNFQSYYLTVDRCAVRDGSNVCTDCVDGLGLYRVGTAPNNLCMTTAEFPAGYGIDTSQSELANLCIVSNCVNCNTNILICSECTVGWYLKTGTCYHPTLSPIIPDLFGPNTVTGIVVACQDTHCKLCKQHIRPALDATLHGI
jgi:hypothetical protein